MEGGEPVGAEEVWKHVEGESLVAGEAWEHVEEGESVGAEEHGSMWPKQEAERPHLQPQR